MGKPTARLSDMTVHGGIITGPGLPDRPCRYGSGTGSTAAPSHDYTVFFTAGTIAYAR